MEEEQLEEATVKLHKLVIELLEEGLSPLAVAGVVQASATKMYRTLLDEQEFEKLMGDVVSSSRYLESTKTFH